MDSSSSISHPRRLSSLEKSVLHLGMFRCTAQEAPLTTGSMSYIPLIAPSTSIARVKFLASIADSFIYVVSKVCVPPRGETLHR
jgi:hypothetical protein